MTTQLLHALTAATVVGTLVAWTIGTLFTRIADALATLPGI